MARGWPFGDVYYLWPIDIIWKHTLELTLTLLFFLRLTTGCFFKKKKKGHMCDQPVRSVGCQEPFRMGLFGEKLPKIPAFMVSGKDVTFWYPKWFEKLMFETCQTSLYVTQVNHFISFLCLLLPFPSCKWLHLDFGVPESKTLWAQPLQDGLALCAAKDCDLLLVRQVYHASMSHRSSLDFKLEKTNKSWLNQMFPRQTCVFFWNQTVKPKKRKVKEKILQ